MTLMDIQKKARHLWRTYGTLNNIVIVVALMIAASWAWGSISLMQTNFAAQKSVDDQKRQAEVLQLEVDTLQYQQNYYNSDEYKDLAARTNLGLGTAGEKVLLLPKNSDAVVAQDKADDSTTTTTTSTSSSQAASNLEQWINFLLGNNAQVLQ